jgi:AraC-like DNA-binding protein
MARIKRTPSYKVHWRFPSIKQFGLATEYFPKYVHRKEELHSVDVVLLSVILRGRGRHMLGDEIHPVTGSSVGVTHYGQSHDIITDAQGMEIYNVYLDLRHHTLPVLPESLRPTLSAILPIHPRLQHHLNRRVSIKIDHPERLAASLRRMKEEMNSPAPGALEIVQHSFQVFLIDLCRAARRHGFSLSRATKEIFPAWVETIREQIDRDFAKPQELAALAQQAGVSVAYLCRFFKNYTGKTVIGYVVERRIQAAIWKLRDGDEKIISIALTSGFNDLAYFNRAFRRIVGTTPSAYRRKIKKSAQVRQRRRGR